MSRAIEILESLSISESNIDSYVRDEGNLGKIVGSEEVQKDVTIHWTDKNKVLASHSDGITWAYMHGCDEPEDAENLFNSYGDAGITSNEFKNKILNLGYSEASLYVKNTYIPSK